MPEPDLPKKNFIVQVMDLYRESVKNFPLLKYSWVLVATICILTLTQYFKLNNPDVFLYALGVVAVSFLGFVFSLMAKSKELVIRIAIYILVYSIIITMAAFILGFASYVFFDKPEFYRTLLNQKQPEKSIAVNKVDSLGETPIIPKPDSVAPDPGFKPPIPTNGFHLKPSPHYFYNGTTIGFKKVIGNNTRDKSFPISAYYISERIPNSIFIAYANTETVQGEIPANKNKPIEKICLEDAKGIAEMLGLKLANTIELINADLAGAISIKEKQFEFIYDPSFADGHYGVITIDHKLANPEFVAIGGRDYQPKFFPPIYTLGCPPAYLRLIKTIEKPDKTTKSFPTASEEELSMRETSPNAEEMVKNGIQEIDVMWKVEIDRVYNNESDAVYGGSQGINVRLSMSTEDQSKRAKQLKVGDEVLVWGKTSGHFSRAFIDIDVDKIKLVPKDE